LGDSVTFGVGVATEETFVGRLQNSFPTLKIWNTAVIGYNVENYETVVRDFLANRKDISQVILFFTLNDLGDNRLSAPRDRGWLSEVHVRVQRHFALVRLLTGLAFDRSKRTFLHDAGLYQRENTRLARSHRILAEVKAELERHGIDLLIVLLPYEYQVRMKQEADLRPQTLLKTQLERRRISFLDTYEAFARSGEDSRRFYLYLDPMHLSSHGHEIVFDAVAERLGRELARRPQPRSASHAIR
jgi:lysophospholipase L1-like esterase